MEAGDEPGIPIEAKESLYRIAQEALNNIAKHARARSIKIKLTTENDWMTLDISDDGIGFDTSQRFPGHLGLHTMRERAEKADGTLTIESASNSGTRIQVMIPLTAR
jgi:signal transduction histidine kinase